MQPEFRQRTVVNGVQAGVLHVQNIFKRASRVTPYPNRKPPAKCRSTLARGPFIKIAAASFAKRQLRYGMPGDFAIHLNHFFSEALERDPASKTGWSIECYVQGPGVELSYGAIQVAQGRPISNQPDIAFIKSYSGCVEEVLNKEFEFVRAGAHSELQSGKSNAVYKKFFKGWNVPIQSLNSTTWGQIKTDDKTKFTRDLIHFLIGPDAVISDYGQAANANEVAEQILPKIKETDTVTEATHKILFDLPSFASFLQDRLDGYFLLITVEGGWDTTLSLDPWSSSERPAESDLYLEYSRSDLVDFGPLGPLGPAAQALKPWAQKMALLRGMVMSTVDNGHVILRKYAMTGDSGSLRGDFPVELAAAWPDTMLGVLSNHEVYSGVRDVRVVNASQLASLDRLKRAG
ncbi:unnamed protein product [Sphagnum jensenii]